MGNEQNRNGIWGIVRWIALGLLIVLVASRFTGSRVSSTPFETVAQAVKDAAELSTMNEGDNQKVRRFFGLAPENYDGILYYTPKSGLDSEEILLVKLKSLDQRETVEKAMEERKNSQANAFEGYAPDEQKMYENAVIEVRGNYLLFVSAADPGPVREAFLTTL